MKTCAVIPAAGLGTRLKMKIPKLLSKLNNNTTLWSILRKKLSLVDHIHVIASPEGAPFIRSELAMDLANGSVTISIQQKPIGMGDAIFQGYPVWSQANNILVVWGDQAFVSEDTLKQSLTIQANKQKTLTLPLARVPTPYVEYLFDANAQLTGVLQSREQDHCTPYGLADVGTFVLSVDELLPAWNAYQQLAPQGKETQEINFLPFLPYLATQGWSVQCVKVLNPIEARGINTPDDLIFFQQQYKDH